MTRVRFLATALLLALCRPTIGQEPQGRTIVRPDAFATLVNPNCSHCVDEAKRRATDLKADDPVLCWIRGYSDGGAIPYRFFLNPYRVISDSYGAFVYDPDAGYARGFPASFQYVFHGWKNGVMLMRHEDGTVFSCLSGKAIDGPRKGERLAPVPTVVSQWGHWLDRYPNAVAYHMFEKYAPVELPTKENVDSIQSRGAVDKRLAAQTPVLGVFNSCPRAYPLDVLAKEGFLQDNLCDQTVVVLWQPKTRTAAAFFPEATPPRKYSAPRPNKLGISPPDKTPEGPRRKVTLTLDKKDADAPFVDKETGSRWDVAGRAVAGELKGHTLTWVDSVQVKWFAWSAEHPTTSIFGDDTPEQPRTDGKKSNAKTPAGTNAPGTNAPGTNAPGTNAPGTNAPGAANDAIKEISGTAEILRGVPKRFGVLVDFHEAKREVTLLLDGEKLAKTWRLTPDAEVKVRGWWGRLGQIAKGSRTWAWFRTDRKKQPNAVFMLADEMTEQDVHADGVTFTSAEGGVLTFKNAVGKNASLSVEGAEIVRGSTNAKLDAFKTGEKIFVESAGKKAVRIFDAVSFEKRRSEQKAFLRAQWVAEGVPGGMGFVHPLSGEADFLVDHEAQRWGRFLKPGDKVELVAEPPIPAVVKTVAPWRDRTQLRLVINGLNIVELESGQRLRLKMKAPPQSWDDSLYPPDVDLIRPRQDRVEWFLASTYCTCGVANDTCTGHFYTLASCNPNGCGAPNALRRFLASKIDEGRTDREILDELYKKHGPKLLKPHLAP